MDESKISVRMNDGFAFQEGEWYSAYVCDDRAIKEALNGSFSIVNGFKDKPSAKIEVPRYVQKGTALWSITAKNTD